MKRIGNIIIITLFILTILTIGNYVFKDYIRSYSFLSSVSMVNSGSVYQKIKEVPLGSVKPYTYQSYTFLLEGLLKFSPNQEFLAIGTENGDILTFDEQGKLIWQKKIGLGEISALEFSQDSRMLYVGENSQDGNLYAVEVATGKEIYRYSTSKELGANLSEKEFPKILSIITDEKGCVYFASQRKGSHADHTDKYSSRLYKFDYTGNNKTYFPKTDNMDTSISWLESDKQGNKIVFGTSNWRLSSPIQWDKTIYCIDFTSDNILWGQTLAARPPYQNATLRNNPNLSADGQYITAFTGDCTAYLFNGQGELLWQRAVSQPQKINGVYINAVGLYSKVTEEYSIFATTNTHNRGNWRLFTPIEDPNSNSIFVFDVAGKLLTRSQMGEMGMIEQLIVENKQVVIAIGRNLKTKSPDKHGVYILDLPQANIVEKIKTIGPCIGVALSRDGQKLAALEAPLQLDTGEIVGEYKLHLFNKKD